jgi:uncharacterized repeat protein (TIGR01451 family)
VPEPSPSPSPTASEPTDDTAQEEKAPAATEPQGPKNDPGPADPPTGSADLVLESDADQLLVQVGDEINYTITVDNPGTEPLEAVFVTDLVPAEIDVLGVVDHPDVEAIQLGQHGGDEDIVWNIGTLAAGQTLELTWVGVAAKPGDLAAVNSVRAEAVQTTTETEDTSYLGAVEDRSVSNPTFKPIKKKIVSYTRPRITKVLGTRFSLTGGVLPFTGGEPLPWLVFGLSMIAAGAAVLMVVKLGPSRTHVIALGLTALLLTACVSDNKPPVDAGDKPNASSVDNDNDDDSAKDDDDGDRVLGLRIKKKDQPTEEPAAELPVEEPAVETVTVLGDPVRSVETVELALDDLAVEDVDSQDGDNSLSYEWDADSLSILTAASSRRLVRGATLELLTSISDNDGDIDITVTLTNLSKRERARVNGRLIHTVYGDDGVIATFESPMIDTVLDPGGSTTATFTYKLPDGSYSAEGSFQAA